MVYKLRERLLKFFFFPARQEPIIVARITIGLCLFLHYLTLWQSVSISFDDTGFIFPARLNEQFFQDLVLRSNSGQTVFVLYLALLFSAIFFASGLLTRSSGLLLYITHSYFYARNEYLFWGWGDLIRPFLIYVICSNPGRWYSLDSFFQKMKSGKKDSAFSSPLLGAGWPTRLIQIHLTTLYVVIAWTRVDDPNWRNGSMVYGILTDPLFARFNFDYSHFKTALKYGTFISWITELSAPFLFWIRSYRKLIVVALWSLHASLEIFTLVGYWNYLVAALLFTFWFDSQPEMPSVKTH